MDYLTGLCGGQIIEARPDKKNQQALDSENYPHKMGVHDLPTVSCMKRGITSCLNCDHEDYPPCIEIAYGVPSKRSL